MLRKADRLVERELDLVSFIARLRRLTISLLASSDRHKRIQIDKAASFVMHESSEHAVSSEDSQDEFLCPGLPKALRQERHASNAFTQSMQ